ncbi:HAD-IIB family hydrolase [Pengzhenrongella sicca]|uniref:HAD-IIB family hydrolase n=1 Tax=Pengzhenrongella sicca TaxID=2819238 RepID=A0A8A4ZA95_9MICO|nr:HAD-IIB family hydrolase [Pengzhenrongella sicca]QTE27949.1 HAD-IIB family hydrolase [Pengzhenrongella sicca]
MQHPFTAPRNFAMVATDLDGTIVPHGQSVSARTRAALQACARAGVRVVFVTGRPPRWLQPVVDATGHTGFAICANGSITLDSAADSVVALRSISNEAAIEVARRLRAAVPDVVFAVETADEIRVESGYEAARGSGRVEGLAPAVAIAGSQREAATLEELLDSEPVIKLVAFSTASTPDGLLAAGREYVTDLVAPTHSSPAIAILEMGPLGVTKATSLAELAQSWGIPAAEVVSFGDMPNDVDMLRWAGTSFAMTGGHADAVSAADHLAPAAADDGVAQVLEYMLAGR